MTYLTCEFELRSDALVLPSKWENYRKQQRAVFWSLCCGIPEGCATVCTAHLKTTLTNFVCSFFFCFFFCSLGALRTQMATVEKDFLKPSARGVCATCKQNVVGDMLVRKATVRFVV